MPKIESVDIIYDLNNIDQSEGPFVIMQEDFFNDSSLNQTNEFQVSQSTTKTSSWQHTDGTTISVDESISLSIPELGEGGSWSVKESKTHTVSWGHSASQTQTWTDTFKVIAQAGKVTRASAQVRQITANIPYNMTINYIDGSSKSSSGIYTGVACYQLSEDIDFTLDININPKGFPAQKIGINLEYKVNGTSVFCQHDFDTNHGIGSFNAGQIILNNSNPSNSAPLDPQNFINFYFNQCSVSYRGVKTSDQKVASGTQTFDTQPGTLSGIDLNDFYTFKLNVAYGETPITTPDRDK